MVDKSSPERDETAEGRSPDCVVDLQSLNTNKIKLKVDEYIKSGSTYHLIGRNRFFKKLGTNSCSGLAYDLLIHGGIKKFIDSRHFVTDNIVVTPNNLVLFVQEAAKNEKNKQKKVKLKIFRVNKKGEVMFRFFRHIKTEMSYSRAFREALNLSKQGNKKEAFGQLNLLLKEHPADPYLRHQLLMLGEELEQPVELPEILISQKK